jgi:hypothetical protein
MRLRLSAAHTTRPVDISLTVLMTFELRLTSMINHLVRVHKSFGPKLVYRWPRLWVCGENTTRGRDEKRAREVLLRFFMIKYFFLSGLISRCSGRVRERREKKTRKRDRSRGEICLDMLKKHTHLRLHGLSRPELGSFVFVCWAEKKRQQGGWMRMENAFRFLLDQWRSKFCVLLGPLMRINRCRSRKASTSERKKSTNT